MKMKDKLKTWLVITSSILLSGCTGDNSENEVTSKKITPVDFTHVKNNDNFWSPRLKNHVLHTLPVCIDQIENKTGRIRNFENAAKRSGEHLGKLFDDSDVYKALEGMAYNLSTLTPSGKRKPTSGSASSRLPKSRTGTSTRFTR